MNVLAVIPARGGSKRLPGKNLADCAGKPMLYWSIKAAHESGFVNRVVVSSDSEQILDLARVYGAEAVLRPDSISGDDARIEEALFHALGQNLIHPDLVVTLQPTCPDRKPGLINACVMALADHPRCNSVLTVRSVGVTWWQQTGESDEWEWVSQFGRRIIPQSQHWELHHQRYAEDGSVFVTRTHALLSRNDRRATPVLPYVTAGCVDVDTASDLAAAAAQLRAREAVSA